MICYNVAYTISRLVCKGKPPAMNTLPRQMRSCRSPEEVAECLSTAQEICADRGAKFTELRKLVLESLWQSSQPIGAYEIMRALELRLGRQLSPITIYRALAFLQGQGLVSRIETRNAFVPCAYPSHSHACAFFICEHCGSSAEIENAKLEALFARDAASLGFRIGKSMIELQGICAGCLSAEMSAG